MFKLAASVLVGLACCAPAYAVVVNENFGQGTGYDPEIYSAVLGFDSSLDGVAHLYNDVAKIHDSLPAYEPADVLGWLKRMEVELREYALRMETMCNAALDLDDFNLLRDALVAQAFSIDRADTIGGTDIEPLLGWAVVATRAAQ